MVVMQGKCVGEELSLGLAAGCRYGVYKIGVLDVWRTSSSQLSFHTTRTLSHLRRFQITKLQQPHQ